MREAHVPKGMAIAGKAIAGDRTACSFGQAIANLFGINAAVQRDATRNYFTRTRDGEQF